LFSYLPDANAFNEAVEEIFVVNDALTTTESIRILEILAQSGTTFSKVLASYRAIIFVLILFATALLVACLVFLVTIVTLNNMDFKLTAAAMETLSVLAEARMDDDVLSGAEIESMVSGRPAADCEEAAGATRIKRLRDTLGNQMVSELLVKNIARRGYMLAIDKNVIKMT